MADNQVIIELLLKNNEYMAKLSQSMAQTKKTAATMTGALDGIKGGFTAIKGSIAAIIGSQVVQYIKQFANEAAKYDTVKRAYENLANSYDVNSKKIIASMQEASQGTLSQQDAMKAASNAMQLMGEDVIEMLPRMSEIAKAAARANGTEVSQMMDDLVTAAGRRSTMILDNLGISSVTAGQKQEEYAAKLGKTRDQLTEAEKSAAFFYAITEAGGEIVRRAGDKTLTLGEQMQVLSARFKDIRTTAFEEMTPGLTLFAKTMSDVMVEGQGFYGLLENIGEYGNKAFARLAVSVATFNELLVRAGTGWDRLFNSGGKGTELWEENQAKIRKAEQLVYNALDAWEKIDVTIEKAKKKAKSTMPKAPGAPAGGTGSSQSGSRSFEGFGISGAGDFAAAAMNRELAETYRKLAAATNDAAQQAQYLKNAEDALKKSNAQIIEGIQNVAKTINDLVGAFDELYAVQAENRLTSLENTYNAMNEYYDWQMQKELEVAGVAEQAASKKAQTEIDALQKQMAKTHSLKKRKALQEQILLKQDELKKAKIEEEAAVRKQNLELLYEFFKREMIIREFNRQKQYQIAMASVNFAAGVIGAMAQGIAQLGPIAGAIVGAVESAALAAVYGVQIATIQATQPPAFAQGAWNLPYDTPAYVHAGETILPRPFAEDFREAMSGGGTEEINVNLHLDGDLIHKAVVKRDKKQARLSGAVSRMTYAGAY